MKTVVSACLLGRNCKYNGGNNYCPEVIAFVEGREVIEVCPEMLAGLGTPRTPMEIQNGILMDREGKCPDKAVRDAVEKILAMLSTEEVECAVLKSRSPTCGVRQVYDGTFSGRLIQGQGVLARALAEAGYQVFDSEEVESLLTP